MGKDLRPSLQDPEVIYDNEKGQRELWDEWKGKGKARNREMLYILMAQVDRLAMVTRKGLKGLNLQLQTTTKMTLQNRMALDTLLIKEHGVCGYLRDRIDHCSVYIPNGIVDVEYDIFQLAHVEQNLREKKHEAEQS